MLFFPSILPRICLDTHTKVSVRKVAYVCASERLKKQTSIPKVEAVCRSQRHPVVRLGLV